MSDDWVLLETEEGVATVTLNRPDVHNAFNDGVIRRLDGIFAELGQRSDVRAVVLRGNGKSFSAGGDLAYMKRAGEMSAAENVADSQGLGRMLYRLHTLPQPTLALVHGNAFAGGMGLLAACDIAVARPDCTFSLSEVRLGLIPSVISPYLMAAMGERICRRIFLTAERFDGRQALDWGLVQEVAEDLDAAGDRYLAAFRAAAPGALHAAKQLIDAVAGQPIGEAVVLDTAQRIADRRASAEAREGLTAFFEKRKPGWTA